MKVSSLVENGVTLISVKGSLDAVASSQFESAYAEILAAGPSKIVVDLAGVEYSSSAGLREVLKMSKLCKSKGIPLAFCALRPAVEEVFSLTGFMNILSVHADSKTAAASLG